MWLIKCFHQTSKKIVFLFAWICIIGSLSSCKSAQLKNTVTVDEKIEKIIKVIIISGDDVESWLRKDNASREYMYERVTQMDDPIKSKEFWARLDVFFGIAPKLPPPKATN